jgi:phosphatidylserine/phosphatidylglycerophosphate/cardiolipin synthase-like enzyme
MSFWYFNIQTNSNSKMFNEDILPFLTQDSDHNDNNNDFIHTSAGATNVCISEVGWSEQAEWIEIYNPKDTSVDVTNWQIVDGDNSTVEIDFSALNPNPLTTIGTGEVITIGHSDGTQSDIHPPNYTTGMYNDFINGGDDIILRDDEGNFQDVVIFLDYNNSGIDLTYPTWYWNSDPFEETTDVDGSIQRINSSMVIEDNNLASDWEYTSSPTNGTLPQYNPLTPNISSILISEVMYGGDGSEWVEIYNNESEDVYIGECTLYSYTEANEVQIPSDITLPSHETYIIGEIASANHSATLSLDESGDVLVLKNSSDVVVDAVVWGTGNSTFSTGPGTDWNDSNNATGDLAEGSGIFRYQLSQTMLSDTNSSNDWYPTSEPTPHGFYEIRVGDVLISEVYPRESGNYEFVEIYNNLSWPITLDGMKVYDYGGDDDEIIFTGNITVDPRDVIVAGENSSFDYVVDTTITDYYEDLVLYLGSTELDVMIFGDDEENTYPRGPDSGWEGITNVTKPSEDGISMQRINGSDFELVDTNTSDDWETDDYTPGYIPNYVPPPPPGNASSVLITEVMINPKKDEYDYEYVEIYNTLDHSIDISNWSLWDSEDWNDSPMVSLPEDLILPAHTYFLFADNATAIHLEYGFEGLNHSESISLTNSEPNDIILADTYKNIIDRVAYHTKSTDYFWDPLFPDNSWKNYDDGVYMGHEDNSIQRLFDPYNNNEYIDETNSSRDWRYDVAPTPGNHTDNAYFLSKPFVENASVITFSSPDNSYDAITYLFRSANSTLDISVYQFTSWWLLQELIDAMDRGVQVRLILEDYFPGASVRNGGGDEAYEQVYVAEQVENHTNGLVRWENKGWRYTHAKYFIVDGEVIVISTENFKYTGIPKDSSAGNRGWGIAVNNTNIAQQYEKVFNLDWEYSLPINETDLVDGIENKEIIHGSYQSPEGIGSFRNISVTNAKIQTLVGPDETISVLVDLIDSATESIYCEIFYLYPTWDDYYGGENNNPLMRALIDASFRGVDVKVILDSKYYNIEDENNNDEAFAVLQSAGIDVAYSNNINGIQKFHVKAFIVDEEAVMISSVNWNEKSTTENREMGIIVNSTEVASYYLTIFNYDLEEYSSGTLYGTQELIIQLATINYITMHGQGPHTWIYWLPIFSLIYFGILITGYYIRRRKELEKTKEELKRIKSIEKQPKMEEETKIKNVPIEVENIRSTINKYYGKDVNVYHLKPNGESFDHLEPSEFIKDYIQINDNLIEIGHLLRPIPRILVLKYEKGKYLVIEGELELQFALFDQSLKAKISQLEDKIQAIDDYQKTPLDDLIAELQAKINQQRSVISKLEEKH